MEANDFKESSPGKLVSISEGTNAFVPNQLIRQLPLEGSTLRLLSRANHSLGELSGISRTLPNPYLLGSPLLRREAILSSRIEGTETTSEQLVLFEAGVEEAARSSDTHEVLNYVNAMQSGLTRLRTLPVSLRLIRELHKSLLDGVRGGRERPGEFRDSQNWIGRPGSSIHEARYVPPPVQQMHEALKDFEQYLHLEAHPAPGGDPPEDEDPSLAPLLIRLALIHYQFEAIHPFRDGNGRVGRLLVPLLLISHGRLRAPLLYVSAYLERHRTLYYDLLLGVSQRGDWTAWLDFFLRGVAESASETVTQADRLLTLREDWRSRFQKARSSALLHKLIDCLFKSPVLTNQRAQSFLKVSAVSASKNVRKLVDAGIVEERTGRKWGQVFVAMDILDLIDKGAEARPPRKKKAPALSRSGPRPRKPLADKSHRDST